MKTYKITFTPTEPYFFGTEKTFRFPNQKLPGQFDSPYFIRSDYTPSQTTLFGAARYLMLKNKDPKFSSYPDGYEKIIGKKSFVISDENDDFGVIEKISPLFMVKDGEEGIYVPVPLDHFPCKAEYTPYAAENVYGSSKQYSPEFNSKEDPASGFMNLTTGSVVKNENIFRTTLRTGIDIAKRKKAFFKKECVTLNNGWSFGIFLDVNDDDEKPEGSIVHLGQNRSVFTVKITQEEGYSYSQEKDMPDAGCIYCMSDSLIPNSVYASCSMAITQLRDYRALETVVDTKKDRPNFKKHEALYKLIRAGSVFWYCNAEQRQGILQAIKNPHCNIAGMNCFCIFPQRKFKKTEE